MIFDDIYSAVQNSRNIAIFTHQNCDGDAIGSSIALKIALEKMGKWVAIYVQKPIHRNYNCLGVKDNINNTKLKSFDLAISVDCPNKKRFGIYEKKFDSIAKSVAIDHHEDFENFADINYGDNKCSSACLLVYRMLKSWNVKFDSDIAKCLYAGIATDTGRFCYGYLDSEVFDAVSYLYSVGFDFLNTNYQLFQRQSFNQVELFKRGINNCKFFENSKIAIVRLDKKDFMETGTHPNDTFVIMDYIKNIETVEIACVLTQDKERDYMVSIRTRKLNAQAIAKTFGGGGHLRASGCRIFTQGDEAFTRLLDACKQELKSPQKA